MTAGYRAESGDAEGEKGEPYTPPPPADNMTASGPAGSGGASLTADLPDEGRVLFDGDRLRDGLIGSGAVAGRFGDSARRYSSLRGRVGVPRGQRASFTPPPAPDVPDNDRKPGAQVPEIPSGGAVKLNDYQRFQETVYNTVYPVLTRIGWQAHSRRGSGQAISPYRITVHHTQGHQTHGAADTAREVRNIQEFHQGPERGWADIGYHFLIDGDGRVAEGRPSNVLGSHALNANDGNLGISLMGDFNVQQVAPAQMDSLERLTAYLAIKYGIDVRRRGYLEGHFHFSPTSCPGTNLKARLGDLRAKVLQEEAVIANSGQTGGLDSFTPLVVTRPA